MLKERLNTLRCFAVMCVTMLGACGGGGGSSPVVAQPVVQPPATEAVSAMGVITVLGSVTVNGVVYETNATTVTMNGQTATFSELARGQIIVLEGTIEVDGPRGTADFVDYEATVIGPVENIDATLGQLLVMGQTVLTDANTVFDPSIDPATFAGLSVGSNAQISGFLKANGELVATRIEPDTTSTGVQVIGPVSGLDLANMIFAMNRLTVDYGSATFIDLPGGMPANGMFVIVRGSLASGVLVVDEIESLYESGFGIPGERTQVHGMITRFGSATDFNLNGFPVTTDASTSFVNGTINDLQANTEITVDGDFFADGSIILANEISIGSVDDPTTTLTFDFADFTDISVSTVFNVTVTHGSDFSVEVIADSDVANRVEVTQTGSSLSIALATGDGNFDTLQALVTMPVLNAIDLTGVVNANLRDFNQSLLTVSVGGVSRLRGDGLTIGDLTANVGGVSELDFGDIRPIGNATIDIGGVSQATLNMDIGTMITGSVGTGQGTSESTLYYFGTNVTVDVTTDPLSSVVKLGETKP